MANPRTVEELEKLLSVAQQRAEEAERQRQKEHQRAEEAEQQLQKAEQLTRRTTLARYIEACHKLVFMEFMVETNKSLTSKGPLTIPRDKRCPANLLPWSDFLEQQKTTLGTLYSTFPSQTEAFETQNFLHGLGERISRKKVANEKDLEYFQHNSVEDPVRLIIQRLATDDGIRNEFDVGDGVVFENHPSAISDEAREVVGRQVTGSPPMTPGEAALDLNQLRPDQICVYRYDNGDTARRSMVYLIEYKAPHKLTLPHLRLGLRPMNIYQEVVNRPTRPTADDPESLFQYHADKLAAAAITQTFHYMIEGGLEYGLLTTGEAIVFLKIDWADPTTLHYHLAEPGPEVLAHPENFRHCTAVGQVLAFTLVALGSPGQRREHSQKERQSAMKRLKTWKMDPETVLQSIPMSERKAPPNSPGYRPRTYKSVDRSPYLLRAKKRAARDHPEVGVTGSNRSPEPSDDESEIQMPDTPSPTRPRNRGQGGQRNQQGTRRDGGQGSSAGRADDRGRQYCTQKCLLGLVGGGLLDEKCPNVRLHRGRSGGVHHPVDHSKWLGLVREQLRQTLDDGVVRLWKEGARGVLFQVTLLVYGYTFTAKGTVPAFVEDLEHETAVYQRLRPIQGVSVPVHLGTIDLRDVSQTYYYDFRVRIVYMMFLSWVGNTLDDAGTLDAMGESPARKLIQSLREMHAMGVAHTDVREPNALWCQETGRVMMVDFERSVLMDPPRKPLAQVVPNKRALTPDGMDTCKATSQASRKAGYSELTRDDILAARMIFPS